MENIEKRKGEIRQELSCGFELLRSRVLQCLRRRPAISSQEMLKGPEQGLNN